MPWVNKRTGKTEMVSRGIDPGWDYNPGMKRQANLERIGAEKLESMKGSLPRAVDKEWVFLEGGKATLQEIKDLGGNIMEEMLNFVVPDDRNIFIIGKSGDPEFYDDVLAAVKNKPIKDIIEYRHGRLLTNFIKNKLYDKLKSVRGVGGVVLSVTNKSGEGLNIAKRVASKLPDDFIQMMNKFPVKIQFYNNQGQGYFSAMEQTIVTGKGSTAEHEFAHWLQQVDTHLDLLFQQEHKNRTDGDPLESMGDGPQKYNARKDNYVAPYQGREYGGEYGAFEVMSMAYQVFFGSDGMANELFFKMVKTDREMLKLIFGTVFHYKAAINENNCKR